MERTTSILQAAVARLHRRRITYRHYDTCVGYGSHRRTPVMGMRGGTINPMEQLCWLPSDLAFDQISENQKSAQHEGAEFVGWRYELWIK